MFVRLNFVFAHGAMHQQIEVEGATLHVSNSLEIQYFPPKLANYQNIMVIITPVDFVSEVSVRIENSFLVTRVRFQGLNRSRNVQIASREETTMAENVTAEGQKGDNADNNERIPGKRRRRQQRDSIFLIQISCGNSSSVYSRD